MRHRYFQCARPCNIFRLFKKFNHQNGELIAFPDYTYTRNPFFLMKKNCK